MRKQLLTSAAVLALSAGAAFASDLPTHKAPPPPPPPPVFSWTGCYVGLHAGGDFGNSTWRSSSYSWGDVGMGTSGAIGGGQVGCNYQVQNFVIGAELEIWGSSLTGSTTRTTDAEGVETYGFKTRSDFAGDLALRGGYAIDRTLLFGKVGIAEARYQFTNTFSFDPPSPTGAARRIPGCCSVSASNTLSTCIGPSKASTITSITEAGTWGCITAPACWIIPPASATRRTSSRSARTTSSNPTLRC